MGAPVASKMLPEKENCTQDFLNAGQYKRNGILRYERVFGHTFVSTGGLTTTKDIVDPIGLKPGMKVLDIGCGTGGSAFYMAKNFGCEGIQSFNQIHTICTFKCLVFWFLTIWFPLFP